MMLRESAAGIGLAKVEAVARTIRLVSNQGMKRVVMGLLTKGQESDDDTRELHSCECGSGGFSWR
jgi:hypothetical protein